MIKKISKCSRDEYLISKLYSDKKNKQLFHQPDTYKDLVVIKPWGYEFLIFESAIVSIWFLHINQGHSTSMHCHPNKRTSLTILGGTALFNSFSYRDEISSCSSIIIEKGVFHSTKALSNDGIDLLELETPSDKLDLVRLNDSYGRKGQGYEGLSEMKRTNLNDYQYFNFLETHNMTKKILGGKCNLSISIIKNKEELSDCLVNENNNRYKICGGAIYCAKDGVIHEIGDIILGQSISENFNFEVVDVLIILTIGMLSS